MARQLTPLGRLLLVACGLALVGYGLYRYGVFEKLAAIVAPEKKPEGTVSKDDFATSTAPGEPGATVAATPGTTGKAGLAGGARLARPIKVAIVTWGGYAGGIVANGGFAPNKESLFFKDFGIQVELLVIDDFEKSRDAFRAGGDKGGVDIMWSTVDAYALEYGGIGRLQPKAILQYDWSRGGDAIAVDASIKSVADLRGKKLACAEATPSHYFALYVLSQGGLTSRDVTWVFTTSAVEAANVFKAGQADAAVSWSPDVYIAAREREGGHILASTKEASNLIADIFVARGDFLDRHPEDTRRFVAGWLKGVELANANPDRTAALLARSFSGIGLEDAKGMLQDVKLPNFAENRAFFAGQGLVTYQSVYKTAQGIWRKIGKISEVFEPYQTVDTRFLDSASEFFPQAGEVQPEFQFKAPPKTGGAPILTKTVSIYFPTGSSSLDENAKYVLDSQVVELAATFGSAYLRVSGNTDNVGGREANLRLSRSRADAVTRYLISKGFERNKFEVVGNGPDKPVASNDSDEGRAKNRRTDFEVIPR
ncbi:MAG TPA: phosphate ABC transporter substrate-binding/OmpA family protein [Vicinamibacteria bacterium]|nr:phosphate ABC transporter substrate-binding/OmpA family protein [Vicinamibacteria bacterium]